MFFLILGLNYAPERIGIAIYTKGLAEALVAAGHAVHVVAGYPYYPGWRVVDPADEPWVKRGEESGVSIQRVPHYVPANPSGLRRMVHHASFGLSALFPMLRAAWSGQPDVVIAVAPSLVAAPVARLAARLVGARAWLHVQDFEVESAFATGLMGPGSALGRLALGFERMVLRGFDCVSAISPQMCFRLLQKGVARERIVQFRNWASIDRPPPVPTPSRYRALWKIQTPHVALYSGNIGRKQGIEIIVEAARRLAGRDDLTFVICGEGPNRVELERLAVGLERVQFHDLQPTESLADLMSLASVHLLPQLAGVADLVLPSKLTNMLASGRPVVAAAAEGTGLWAEMVDCGIAVPPGDAEAFAAAIDLVTHDADLAREFGANALHRAERHWSKAQVLDGFIDRLTMLVGERR